MYTPLRIRRARIRRLWDIASAIAIGLIISIPFVIEIFKG